MKNQVTVGVYIGITYIKSYRDGNILIEGSMPIDTIEKYSNFRSKCSHLEGNRKIKQLFHNHPLHLSFCE